MKVPVAVCCGLLSALLLSEAWGSFAYGETVTIYSEKLIPSLSVGSYAVSGWTAILMGIGWLAAAVALAARWCVAPFVVRSYLWKQISGWGALLFGVAFLSVIFVEVVNVMKPNAL